MIQNEVDILKRVKHPNIVELIEEFDSHTELFLVMELIKVTITVIGHRSTSFLNNTRWMLTTPLSDTLFIIGKILYVHLSETFICELYNSGYTIVNPERIVVVDN